MASAVEFFAVDRRVKLHSGRVSTLLPTHRIIDDGLHSPKRQKQQTEWKVEMKL